ncbi:MAG: hydantoinase/oxoprolinase family protein [Gammaproteobacteria bacterium]|nr:hydantoinase/oxoprolinase family protein [Gammaproteobacteria bacterium]
MLLGIDTGGTFTDFVLLDQDGLRVHKVLSTPQAPEHAILQGIAELGLDLNDLQIVHGSTVATNAVLERKGVRTAYLTNLGLEDVLSIGRQARAELYQLQSRETSPPVLAELCLGVRGRLSAQGEWLDQPDEAELQALREQLRALNPQAVAINLLFSFLDNRVEQQLRQWMPEGVFVCLSSDILPEYKEYERGISTWLNAYVGPLVQGYLQRLQSAVSPAPLTVMQSSGGTMTADHAGRRAVHMLLSGPAGGLQAASYMGRLAGCERLLTFDMGGTSTDVALLDGEVRLTSEGQIAGYPVAVPMVDMHTIGAGGGSIAYIDEGGMLQVGPESAGALPGPVCYGRGGTRPTVTDANLVLGRLQPEAFSSGGMVLDVAAARASMAPLAAQLGLSIEQLAQGIVQIANEHMAQALRVISVQRGVDPSAFQLMCFGGAGGVHVCALADALGMRQAIVPMHAGVLSALGMLVAPRSRQLSRTVGGLLRDASAEGLQQVIETLAEQGEAELVAEGVTPCQMQGQISLDLRYRGQSYTLNVPWQDLATSEQAFHQAHLQRYGYQLEHDIELVNVRLRMSGPMPSLALPRHLSTPASAANWPMDGWPEAKIIARQSVSADDWLSGPLLITEPIATTLVAPGWKCQVDQWGNLRLSR